MATSKHLRPSSSKTFAFIAIIGTCPPAPFQWHESSASFPRHPGRAFACPLAMKSTSRFQQT
jgi:hypothetical protein